jgi:hypothetical protein
MVERVGPVTWVALLRRGVGDEGSKICAEATF